MRPGSGSDPEHDPCKEIAAEILLRHRNEEKSAWLPAFVASLLQKLRRGAPPNPEPPLAGVRQPLGRGPRPRSGAAAMKEPW